MRSHARILAPLHVRQLRHDAILNHGRCYLYHAPLQFRKITSLQQLAQSCLHIIQYTTILYVLYLPYKTLSNPTVQLPTEESINTIYTHASPNTHKPREHGIIIIKRENEIIIVYHRTITTKRKPPCMGHQNDRARRPRKRHRPG